MAFGNLTVDFRQLARVPVRDRVALAQSSQASDIFGNLTPSQIAALFPDYYKKFIPQGGGGGMAAGMTGAGTTTGTGTGTATSTGYTGTTAPTTPAGPTRLGYIEDILKSANPPTPSSVGAGVSDPRVKKLLGIISSAEGTSSSYDIQYGHQNIKREQAGGKPLTQMTINEVRQLMMNTPKNKRAMGKYQFVPDTFDAVVSQMGLKGDELFDPQMQDRMIIHRLKYTRGLDDYLSGKITKEKFSQNLAYEFASFPSIAHGGRAAYGGVGENTSTPRIGLSTILDELEAIRLMPAEEPSTALPGTAPIDPTMPASDTGMMPLGQGAATTTVTPQLQAFDAAIFAQLDPRIQEYYKTATDDEKKQLESAISKLGTSGVQEIMQRHPKATAEAVTGKVVAENMDTASNVSEMVNQDPLAFWKQRNPQGAKIDDLDIETLRTSMMAAMKLEADAAAQGKPKKVEIYGGESGVRYNPSKPGSRHGVNFKEALDIAIYDVDPNTGQKMKTKSGAYGNYSNKPNHGGIDPEGFALYHEFGQNAELARVYLANQGDTNYQNWALRQGGLFGDVEWDFMHIDRSSTPGKYGVSAHANPGRRGSVAYGYTETALRELGIDPNSDGGRRLMTGVIERFGGETPSKEAIAEAAQKAFGQKPQPKLSEDTAKIVQSTPEQPLPGTEAQTQQQGPNDTDLIDLKQSQGQAAPTANTAPAMKLGGEMDFKEPNSVKESMSLMSNGKEVAQFNKNENVNVEDGKIKVQNEYDKRIKEAQQRNDKGAPQANQYNMRQSPANEMPRTFPDQVKYGIVPQSPSAKRQFETAQFGGYDHFSRRSHSS